MWIPFREKFDAAFRSGRRPAVHKVLIGIILGLWVGLYVSFQVAIEGNPSLVPRFGLSGLVAACLLVTVVVVLGLIAKDSTGEKVKHGERVNPLFRLLLLSGGLSLFLWFVIVLVSGITIAVYWP